MIRVAFFPFLPWAALALTLVLLSSMRAEADPYRLVAGDEVQIVYPGSETPIVAVIDIDGNIRLPGLRGVTIAAKTLDEAEAFVEQALSDASLYVTPRVSISVSRYAPVIVAGDVSNRGQYDYLPGMTVSAALGLAGGRATDGPSPFELARAETATRSRLSQFAFDIANAVVKIAALDAFLDGREAITLTDAQRASVPEPVRDRLAGLIEAEKAYLQTRLDRRQEMLRMWASEIESMESRSQISTGRLELQKQIVANLSDELANAQDLAARGLQTSNRLSEIVQRNANARARALEIEGTEILMDQSISEAMLERFSFKSLQRQDALRERREARIAFEKARLDYAREAETLATLQRANPISALSDDRFTVSFDLISPRPGRNDLDPIQPQTLLLPGDTLIVTVTPSEPLR